MVHLTVYVLSVADVLEVAARVLTTELRLRSIGLQSRVVVPPVLGARRHAAGCCIPHGARRIWEPRGFIVGPLLTALDWGEEGGR